MSFMPLSLSTGRALPRSPVFLLAFHHNRGGRWTVPAPASDSRRLVTGPFVSAPFASAPALVFGVDGDLVISALVDSIVAELLSH